jgi:hypothetical protein
MIQLVENKHPRSFLPVTAREGGKGRPRLVRGGNPPTRANNFLNLAGVFARLVL